MDEDTHVTPVIGSSIIRYPGIGRLFSLGGLSECGKSIAGQYLASHGVLRIKIARLLADVGRELLLDPDDPTFTDQLYTSHASIALSMFIECVAKHMVERGVQLASLESMYRSQTAIFLKDVLGQRMVHTFIEAPLELRIEREWRKLGGEPREAVACRVREKDAMKQRLGVPQLRPLADVVLDNSGSLQDYRSQLDRLLDEFPSVAKPQPRVLPGKPPSGEVSE